MADPSHLSGTAATPKPSYDLQSHSSATKVSAVSHDTEWLAYGHADGYITVQKTTNSGICTTHKAGTHAIHALAFSPDNTHLASTHNGGRIKVWSLDCDGPGAVSVKSTVAARFQCESVEYMHTVVWSPDGSRIATISSSSSVYICDWPPAPHYWGSPALECRPLDFLNPFATTSICFSPNSQLLACGGSSGLCYIWDFAHDELHRELHPHTAPRAQETIHHLSFDAQCSRIMLLSSSGALRVYAVSASGTSSSAPLFKVTDPRTRMEHASFLPDGRLLFLVASKDGQLFLGTSHGPPTYHHDPWRWLCGSRSHIGRVGSVHFSPTGAAVAIVSETGAVCVWQTPPAAATDSSGLPPIGEPHVHVQGDPHKVAPLVVFGRDENVYVSSMEHTANDGTVAEPRAEPRLRRGKTLSSLCGLFELCS